MPTYQYRCTDCGEPLEVVQSFTDDALTVCPACSGALRKVYGSVGVVFKGSGFYRTDSRAEAKSSSSSNGKAETKTETKTETKSEPKSDKSAASTSTSSSSESSTSKSSAA